MMFVAIHGGTFNERISRTYTRILENMKYLLRGKRNI